jgi:hypothetical protein
MHHVKTRQHKKVTKAFLNDVCSVIKNYLEDEKINIGEINEEKYTMSLSTDVNLVKR